jgi:DNA-binding GntR family transcriptional regulator
VILEQNGNNALGIVLNILQRIILRHYDTVIKARRPWTCSHFTQAIYEEHQEVLTLIEDGDALAAEESWRAHTQAWGADIMKEFGGDTIVALPV